MATGQEIITDAALFAGLGDQYNALDATTVNLYLRGLNDLIDSISTEELTIFGYTEGTFPLIAAQQVYLVGPANQLGLRPTQVETLTIVDAQNVSHPVQIIGTDQWADIVYKPAPGRPEYMYNDGNVPISNWYFWPLPAFASDVVHVWYWAQIQQFTALTNSLVAPPGYTLYLKTALAELICAQNDKELSPSNQRIARKARANARALSRQPKVLGMDVPMQGPPWFNIFTGSNV